MTTYVVQLLTIHFSDALERAVSQIGLFQIWDISSTSTVYNKHNITITDLWIHNNGLKRLK